MFAIFKHFNSGVRQGAGLTKLVEFIPKTDNMIKIMLNLKGDIFPDYNEDNFINIMKKYVKIIKIQEIGNTGRKVIEFDGS